MLVKGAWTERQLEVKNLTWLCRCVCMTVRYNLLRNVELFFGGRGYACRRRQCLSLQISSLQSIKKSGLYHLSIFTAYQQGQKNKYNTWVSVCLSVSWTCKKWQNSALPQPALQDCIWLYPPFCRVEHQDHTTTYRHYMWHPNCIWIS